MGVEVSRKLLATVLGTAIEEAAFVFTEDTDEPPPFEREVMEARLAYRGPQDGELLLAAAPSFAATLAANLLGEEEGGAVATGDDQDALGELLNMIAGAAVIELFGQGASYTLGLPSVRLVSPAEHHRALAAATAAATMVDEDGRRIDLAAVVGGAEA